MIFMCRRWKLLPGNHSSLECFVEWNVSLTFSYCMLLIGSRHESWFISVNWFLKHLLTVRDFCDHLAWISSSSTDAEINLFIAKYGRGQCLTMGCYALIGLLLCSGCTRQSVKSWTVKHYTLAKFDVIK